MIKYYVMRNSRFRIDFSNQSPQWSRHCERPRVPAERGTEPIRGDRSGPSCCFFRVYPECCGTEMLLILPRDHWQLYRMGQMFGLRGMWDAFVFGVATWFLENQEKIWERYRVTQRVSSPTEIPSSGNRIYFLAISHYTILNMRLPQHSSFGDDSWYIWAFTHNSNNGGK